MRRRGFFGALAGLIGSAALDPERLLWTPGERTIFVPPSGGWTPVVGPLSFHRYVESITSESIKFRTSCLTEDLALDDYANRHLKQAIDAVAQRVDEMIEDAYRGSVARVTSG